LLESDSDDEYGGYFIPARSFVIANAWYFQPLLTPFFYSKVLICRAMLHDPAAYPDPFKFKPERFLKDGKLDETIKDPKEIAFGFGRRYNYYHYSWSTISYSRPF
jgi:hypothetical protein